MNQADKPVESTVSPEVSRVSCQSGVGDDGLSIAVEQSADSVVITDCAGRIQYVNPAFTAMTGYSKEEALGNTPRLLNSASQSAIFYEEFWETIGCGNT